MAKIVITLEDTGDKITLSMDHSNAPRNIHGDALPTPAMRLSRQLFDLAMEGSVLDDFPKHIVQPTNTTVH